MQLTLTQRRPLVALAAMCAAVLIASMGLLIAQPASASAAYVSSARWVDGTPFGPTLSIEPTWQGKVQGRYNPGGLMREALQKSGRWLWTNSLYNQLRCHTDWATFRNKTPWNLDAGRPDVGYWSTVHAKCNPSGPGD